MAVTIITADARYDASRNAVIVTGQCFARPGTPAAGNIVDISSSWGASAHTQSTQSLGQYAAALAAASSMVGQTVTCNANGAQVSVQVH
jgi:hypothetical protein